MGNKLIFSLAGAVFCFAASGLAVAADMAVKMPVKAPPIASAPVYTWTGCYIGGNVGGGWAHTSFTEGPNSGVVGASDGSHTASGWLGGGQVGCDYQFASNWVVGVRGMWEGANLTGSNQGPAATEQAGGVTFVWHTKTSSVASLVGEVGYLFTPTTKFYGKAGIGWVRDRFTCDSPCSFIPPPSFVADNNRSGFDLGVGLAWMFAPNWDFFVEYDHMWLGTKTVFFSDPPGCPSNCFNEIIKQDLNQVIAGVDYRFNWWGH